MNKNAVALASIVLFLVVILLGGTVTAEDFVTRFGVLNLSCTQAGSACFPVKLVNAYVGTYGGQLSSVKHSDTTPVTNPERDIYFCAGVPCAETAPSAAPSGWLGSEN
jgi:hypothetical protein